MTGPTAIQKFLNLLQTSLDQDAFVGLRLTHAVHKARLKSGIGDTKSECELGQTTPGEAALDAVDFRLIELRGEPHLSMVLHEPKRDVTRNLSLTEGRDWIRSHIGKKFQNALLRTTHRDWQLHCPGEGAPRLVGHKPATATPPPRDHDAPRQTLLGSAAGDWLQELGITHPNGRPKVSMADKHRQIGRYVEILQHLARDCGWTAKAKPDAPLLKLADMGCGKGYLTFAAWHLFHRTLHRPASVLGVETRMDLVNGANQAARRVNAPGLEFVPGEISSVPLPQLDALIALHACNTATDDAIRRGIVLGARLIIVAPCCHQALRPSLGDPEPFTSILRHGLFKERLAEWLSDGLRTLFLEWAGYQTKAIEFVGSEHTPKNLMITAVRKYPAFADAAAKERILELKQFFGIKTHALDELLQ